MPDEFRKVRVWTRKKQKDNFSVNAYFHRWVEQRHLTHDGKQFDTVYALVERESDGQVQLCEPQTIQFVDDFPDVT